MQLREPSPASEALDLRTVEQEIDRFSAGGYTQLRFSAPVEQTYASDRSRARRKQLIVLGLFALGIFDLFLIGDYLMAPEHILRAVVVRLGIITPLVLVTSVILQRRTRMAVQEATASSLCILGCTAVLYLHQDVDAAASLQAEPATLLILLTINTLLRTDFWYAVAATVVCYCLWLLFLVSNTLLTFTQRASMGGRVFWFAVLSLAANYALSREQRFSWLLQRRDRFQREALSHSNRELLNLSFTDPLTSLPNRAAYDRRLAELWEQSADSGIPLTAIMVDVDHFKAINDSFGHLYGDRVLQRVASLLEQAMRAEADFVARFGGEEFIVLLPGSSLEAGVQVAERIRVLVEVAGSPAPIRGDNPLPEVRWSTVSCGVAALHAQPGSNPETLIDAADSALYAAKQSGRNRVCAAAAAFMQSREVHDSGSRKAQKPSDSPSRRR